MSNRDSVAPVQPVGVPDSVLEGACQLTTPRHPEVALAAGAGQFNLRKACAVIPRATLV
jgi:hypothetical protein